MEATLTGSVSNSAIEKKSPDSIEPIEKSGNFNRKVSPVGRSP